MKTFYVLLSNILVSSITNFTVWFALIFFLYLQTRSVTVTSVISGIFLVATAGTGFLFGSLVDKYNKKPLLIYSSMFSLFMFILSFLIYLYKGEEGFSTVSDYQLWIFVILVLAGVIAGNIRGIVLSAVIPLLVAKDKIDKANGLAGMVTGLAMFVVSVISGILVGHSGMFLIFVLSIFFTAGCIVHMVTIKLPKNDKPVKEIINTDAPEVVPIDEINIKETLKIIKTVPGLMALILFSTFNNFLGGVFMSLMDAYGLNLVSVQVWGFLWGGLSLAFIIGGLFIAKFGLGKNPLRTLFTANLIIWSVCCIFTLQSSILLLTIGMLIYLSVVPFIEASEHTIIQRVVPPDKLGRVFGFAQSIEQAASPLTAFAIGPITQVFFIPFMTDGKGAELIGDWFGTGPDRGMALVFTLAGVIGLITTLVVMNSRFYKNLSKHYQGA